MYKIKLVYSLICLDTFTLHVKVNGNCIRALRRIFIESDIINPLIVYNTIEIPSHVHPQQNKPSSDIINFIF